MINWPNALRIIESEHATTFPTAKPRTLDMQEMVDHFHSLGLIQRRPAAFETPAGLVVHPTIARKMREQLSRKVRRRQDETAFSALMGRSL